MTETIRFVEESTIELIDSMGTDARIAQAARVSTLGEEAEQYKGNDAGLIRYLMQNRHGSPFEHNAMTFLVKAPQFVFYEWHRHRVGFSYNEESGRYRELQPEFYLPPLNRPVSQVGKASQYRLEPGTTAARSLVQLEHVEAAHDAWKRYKTLLNTGVAKEVARNVLPVSLMKTMYVTCNARSMLNLLSLRTSYEDHPNALYKSTPLWEFARIADGLEEYTEKLYPVTLRAFNDFGRVAP